MGDTPSPELTLQLYSVSAMTAARVERIGDVFDRYPGFRPTLVGGDPPRTAVGASLSALLRKEPLPIQWIGGSRRSWNDDTLWDINLHRTWDVIGEVGHLEIYRPQHDISVSLPRPHVDAAGGIDEFVRFCTELGEAMGASYGYGDSSQLYRRLDAWYNENQWGRPDPCRGLGSVFWLQYFGPGFVKRYPPLSALPGSVPLPSGGVVYRATTEPRDGAETGVGPLGAHWKRALVEVLGTAAFAFDEDGNKALPTMKEHIAHDDEDEPFPADLAARLRRESDEREERRAAEHEKASRTRRRLEARRSPPVVTAGADEWSTSMDSDEFPRWWRAARSALGVDLTGPYAGALAREIANAPVDSNGTVTVASQSGTFELSWWVDDYESLIVTVIGPDVLIELTDAM